MKMLKYKHLSCEINIGTEEKPQIERVFLDKSMGWNETNEEIAKREAYNGEYTIEDDGQSDHVSEPTTEEILDAMLGVTE